MIENRKYLIIHSSEISKINFDEILFRDVSQLFFNIDGTKTIIKWDSINNPDFIKQLNYKEGPFNNSQIIDIINGVGWVNQ